MNAEQQAELEQERARLARVAEARNAERVEREEAGRRNAAAARIAKYDRLIAAIEPAIAKVEARLAEIAAELKATGAEPEGPLAFSWRMNRRALEDERTWLLRGSSIGTRATDPAGEGLEVLQRRLAMWRDERAEAAAVLDSL